MKRINLIESYRLKYKNLINPDLIYLGLLQTSTEVFLEKILDSKPELIVQHNLENVYDSDLEPLLPHISAALFNPLVDIDDNACRFLLRMDPLSIAMNYDGIFSEEATERLLNFI
ncbi:hypothetical protein [Psychroflexus sediminis]|uniref:Uncharacterized protein n=1 Tax=Psychroflexus sediminis TaxID=470826 RepID=A0A1G7VV07_9FLAO|nr:hypothetical protein [Psychroflexus sediminis]SDG62710.1 hypothetical protein SAMN04488027_104114 [Psychroflexus sediminis]